MNKSAVELSINFIVMFILAMAMFAAGITIARQIFTEADEVRNQLSEQQKRELESVLRDGDKVQTIFVSQDIGKGESGVFGLGIRNDFDEERDFYVEAVCDAAYTIGNSEICEDSTPAVCDEVCDDWFYIDGGPTGTFSVKSNDLEIVDLFVVVEENAVSGTYVFNVRVCTESECQPPGIPENQYGVTKKFTVVVR